MIYLYLINCNDKKHKGKYIVLTFLVYKVSASFPWDQTEFTFDIY